ncbi:U6 snRNA-associated Sm-like protein LSm3 isoform X1 [Ovis aries]|uniref:U6 snRNA-associated Sm-like protein LSm3 isoform X1 n=1 Tax=Ovis aries TaxID=9940 RepID=UPI0029526178|nr:U6 snRNA-associated Sm-like protein LSm3 isoform X1 [Ovis aries]
MKLRPSPEVPMPVAGSEKPQDRFLSTSATNHQHCGRALGSHPAQPGRAHLREDEKRQRTSRPVTLNKTEYSDALCAGRRRCAGCPAIESWLKRESAACGRRAVLCDGLFECGRCSKERPMCILMLKISKNSSTPEISWFVDNSQILQLNGIFIFLQPFQ